MANWFGPKRLGYGFRPVSAAGWVVTAVFILLLVVWKRNGQPSFGLPTPVVPAVLIVAFALVAYASSRSTASKRQD